MTIRIVPLGAGQDVGRSCILVTIGTKNIMFDCGFHMGYNDARRFPDFTYISKQGNFTDIIDCVIISHFHLDHCGALPYFTEMLGYDGPIYMTHPTKAICPLLLEDYRKISVDRKGETNFFTSDMIKKCMKKVIPIQLHQTIYVDDELEIKAYYAGHVLGAAMIYAKVGQESVVYTGDYNMTPDRHLGSAWIDKLRPDVLITESTYGTTIRDSKRSRERDFLKKVHDCVADGGKVVIPCFALGRAQELCILIESYWERMDLKVPVYFSTGLTERANEYYKLFIHWTNQKIKSTFVQRNMFDFKHIQPWNRKYMDHPGPMVVFATPGMLHQGTSLEIFKKFAPDPKNMVIMPGYCVAGTVGAKVLSGQKVVDVDAFTKITVNLQVRNLSFSAHADAKGIMQLIRHSEPRHVVLVHGERGQMDFLKSKIMKEFGIPCLNPANGVSINIETSMDIPGRISMDLLKTHWRQQQYRQHHSIVEQQIKNHSSQSSILSMQQQQALQPPSTIPINGVLLMTYKGDMPTSIDIVSKDRWKKQMDSACTLPSPSSDYIPSSRPMVFQVEKEYDPDRFVTLVTSQEQYQAEELDQIIRRHVLDSIYIGISQMLGNTNSLVVEKTDGDIQIKSVLLSCNTNKLSSKKNVLIIQWDYVDEDLASYILGAVNLVLYDQKRIATMTTV
ncbi:beta-lactamase-like protein [Halteromyces radiatus]|uniref:beta-lactamase-like protein n=1 Tax=Halteromyces radiatus TaxID=101107 RepID=UPI0022205E71|nr:beta-lactamase-like protein [Halteromyces radiatus]KAI8085189.1 beta-lactamase-like protein [Halteromyces radiatus]